MVKGDQPKLIDFGIARSPNRIAERHAPQGVPYTMLQDNRLLGTPNYMSPEQALGKQVDARTDIYSLGAVMYEMLTGRTPFHADSAEKLLQQVAYKAPPTPHEVDPKIPVELSEITMRAMSKRPEKRYQEAGQMALEIRIYLLQKRRARKRMQMAMSPGAQREPEVPALSAGSRRWTGYLLWAAAAMVAGIVVLRLALRF
jgi:serine/threonine-protein kinase